MPQVNELHDVIGEQVIEYLSQSPNVGIRCSKHVSSSHKTLNGVITSSSPSRVFWHIRHCNRAFDMIVANGKIVLRESRTTKRPLYLSILLYTWIILKACNPLTIRHGTWNSFWADTTIERFQHTFELYDPNCFENLRHEILTFR